MANWAWKWKHWEVRIAGWHLGRWCDGAPCYLTPNVGHPISMWRCRHRG